MYTLFIYNFGCFEILLQLQHEHKHIASSLEAKLRSTNSSKAFVLLYMDKDHSLLLVIHYKFWEVSESKNC